ncbi:hypothetical protein FisN_10Lh404 [Fistulifera solaris]|uniref:Uncharacterized protein n=1 Tax=Fistulifera solaris TaxID=1519565 RepID=A0A1Z5JVA5_FISSO|nr:hypothetical protein FisN_10Lh404 [Fistulifera solaris]|eukprot:GAX17708.1 hypothetical protein FisN_10Lh404 [Fistulifera solaris]
MKVQQVNEDDILQLIPTNELSPRQQELRLEYLNESEPIYRFVREPISLNDVDWGKNRTGPNWWQHNRPFAIWRDNETLINLWYHHYGDEAEERSVNISLSNIALGFTVYGKTDEAIAETLTFLWSLKHQGEEASLQVNCFSMLEGDALSNFDFGAIRDDQLIRILESNPTRQLELEIGSWTPEQAKILATRSFPLKLKIVSARGGSWGTSVKVDGTVLVDELEKRNSLFGSLVISGAPGEATIFSRVNLIQLMNLEGILDKIEFFNIDPDCALVPFATKANSLQYTVEGCLIRPEDIHSVDIETKNLDLSLFVKEKDDRDGLLISFFNRAAQLGHFESLGISLTHFMAGDDTDTITRALVGAINSNSGLKHLKLGGFEFLFINQDGDLKKIFHTISQHDGLRTIDLQVYPPIIYAESEEEYERESKPYYSALERLLILNRNLVFYNHLGRRISNVAVIDNLYFYNEMVNLWKESGKFRSLLIIAALTQRAIANFQYTGRLLSNHTDMLCELVAGLIAEEIGDSAGSPLFENLFSFPTDRFVSSLKRKREC